MLNASNGSSDQAFSYNGSTEHPVFIILVLVITILVGVPGNILVLWVTGIKMKWTVTNIWFWNLAVADIICCLSLPLSIAQLFYDEWLYGPVLCMVLPSIVILNMFASIFTLVAISIDRCILVIQPVWAQNHRNLQMTWFLCLVIWILSFLMCLPVFLYRKVILIQNITICGYQYNEDMYNVYMNSYNYSLTNNNTDENFSMNTHASATGDIITITRMIFGFLFPLLIISSCYIVLALKVQNSRFGKVSRKTTNVVIGIIAAFCVTWAPYHIIGLTMLYVKNTTVSNLDFISQALAYSNSCINPILYVFIGKDFKTTIRQSLIGVMESAFREEMTTSTEHSRSKSLLQESIAV